MDSGAILTAVDIHLWRGERHLLRGASITATGGMLVQVAGANGSGKTTLLRVLAGLTEAEEGSVRWQCDDGFNWPTARGRVAYLGHRDALDDALSVVENIRYGVAMSGWQPTDTKIDQTLESLGLTAQAQLPAKLLSAGQRRRTALARVFLGNKRAWLLDEPYTHLDTQGRALLNQHIDAQLAAHGLIILTTHEETALPRPPDLKVTL